MERSDTRYQTYLKILKEELIPAMGHAVYSISDPRADIFRDLIEKLAKEKHFEKEYALYSIVERLAPRVIGEKRHIYKGVSPNVDFYSGLVYSMADGRQLFRVLENLFTNAAKYAMPGTRVYVDLSSEDDRAIFSLKNVSRQQLNISSEELTERFIRGDLSRSTEGSGLGLSIAKSLTELQKGTFEIYLDGDLFRVTVSFPVWKKQL